MTIEIEIINTADGGLIIIPSKDQVAVAAAKERQRANDLLTAAEALPDTDRDLNLTGALPGSDRDLKLIESRVARFRADQIIQKDIELRERYKVQKVSFEVRSYSYGEKAEIKRRHTTWQGSTPVLDGERFVDELVAFALHKTLEEFDALNPTLAAYLRSEVLDRLEPSEARIDFLYWLRTTSEPERPLEESASSPK